MTDPITLLGMLWLCLNLNAPPQQLVLTPKGGAATLETLFFSRGHEHLFFQDTGGETFMWNLKSGDVRRYDTERQLLLTGFGERLLFIRDDQVQLLKAGKEESAFELSLVDTLSGLQSATLSPYSILLAVVDESAVSIYNVRNGQRRHHFVLNERSVGQIGFSPDGRYLAVSLCSGQVITWETNNWQTTSIWTSIKAEAPRFAWHPTTPVIVCTEGDNLFFHDIENDLEWTLRKATSSDIQQVAIHPTYDQLATLQKDNQILLHHYRTGETMHTIDLDIESSEHLVFSSDGRLLVVAGEESIQIYEAATARQLVGTTLSALREQAESAVLEQHAQTSVDIGSSIED